MAERKLPDDPLSFIRECLRGGQILQNDRIVTAYYPSPEEWEIDVKTLLSKIP